MSSVASPSDSAVVRDVAARGARIRFVDAGSGPPLLLVHDYLASRAAWDEVLDDLARSFRVLVPDLPGFGESEKPPPGRYAYGCEAFAESLVDLVASAGLGRVAVCGLGMGGSVALTMAAKHPHVVERLVLVSPHVYPARPELASRLAGLPVIGPLVFKQLYGRTLFRAYFRDRIYAPFSRFPVDRIDLHFELFNGPAAREAAYATMMAMQDTRPLIASVPRVSAPALIVWGRADRQTPVEHGRRLARELRGARFEVLECGHSPPEECARDFVEAVRAFLRRT
jgi:pimeloyl-ACP methyl ester carboxylesterase